MKEIILEIGFKLDKELKYYHDLLINNHALNVYNCKTHDIYYTNKNLNSLTENEMKKACVRFRDSKGFSGTLFDINNKPQIDVGNYQIFDKTSEDRFKIDENKLNLFEQNLINAGWKKVFDTSKTDYQYVIGNMKSRIQIQDIKDIGLLLYYDNPDFYHLPLDEQREHIIDELNSYGFNFKYDELGLDKLRTLYYKEEKYSRNQNG